MRVAIIDDEPPARRRLSEMLSEHGGVKLVGEAGNVAEGVELCLQTLPDAIFLDIEMGRSDGFELLEMLPEPRPGVVFVTAHEGFALPAFEASAVDYLLKPVAPERLQKALVKLQRFRPQRNVSVPIPCDHGIVSVEAETIACVQADQNYTRVFLQDGRSFYVRRGIQAWAELLPEQQFARLHRSLIVNLKAVRLLQAVSRDAGELFLNGVTAALPLARRALHRLRQLLG